MGCTPCCADGAWRWHAKPGWRRTQRGNNRQDVFLLDEDRPFYIDVVKAKAGEHGLTIVGSCLMTSQVHLVAAPKRADSLAKAIGQAHWRNTMRFHRRYGRSGHLWQGRFYSCPLSPTHLVAALAYKTTRRQT